ncbi:MAG: class I SAM-dependent methyltransferase [Haliea sp.]|nr:class I SAM-dependent methyltransferase [Haliea sp.]
MVIAILVATPAMTGQRRQSGGHSPFMFPILKMEIQTEQAHSMIPNLYQQTAGIYDFVISKEVLENDLEFYLSLIKSGQTVIDIGCGTGRVSLELAKIGCHVTGVDLSEKMLEEFRKKIPSQYADRFELLCCNMNELDLAKKFDWIIFPYRTFQALRNDSERVACLESVRKMMHPLSRVVITLFNPNPGLLKIWGTAEMQGFVDFDVPIPNENFSIRRIASLVDHDIEQQTLGMQFIYQKYDKTGVLEELPDALELGYLYPAQCEEIFLRSGFIIEKAYGSYNFEPIVEGVYQEQVFVLKCE